MNRFLTGLILLAITSASGCDNSHEPAATDSGAETAERKDGGGISVKLPGVEIDINEETGVDVKAPGTNVSVRKDGVNVTAPGTNVSAGKDGVDVTAPNVNIRTKPAEESNE